MLSDKSIQVIISSKLKNPKVDNKHKDEYLKKCMWLGYQAPPNFVIKLHPVLESSCGAVPTLFKAQGLLGFPWISSKSTLPVKNSRLSLSGVEKRAESQRQLSRLHSSWQNTGTRHPSAKELIKAAALLMINSVISSKQPELLAKFLHQKHWWMLRNINGVHCGGAITLLCVSLEIFHFRLGRCSWWREDESSAHGLSVIHQCRSASQALSCVSRLQAKRFVCCFTILFLYWWAT